jgi:hypothetical protein
VNQGFFCKIWTVPERLPPIGQWSIFCYKSILKGEILGYMFFFKNCIWATEFFSMKPNWLLRFHGYHTFAYYLNFHPTILAITKLCLFNYYNDTNLPWGIEPQPHRVLPTTTRECNKGVLHPYIAQPWNPPPNFQTAKPNAQTKSARLLTYTILQTEQKPPKPKIKSTIQPNISLSPLSIMQLHHHMGS